MDTCENIQFVCPACTRSIEITESVRDALVESGCVICGADVDDSAFALEKTAQRASSPSACDPQ